VIESAMVNRLLYIANHSLFN